MASSAITVRITGTRRRRRTRARSGLRLYLPLGFLAVLTLACFVLPSIYEIRDPLAASFGEANTRPFRGGFIFGSDQLGRDLFSRVLYGGRVSLRVGIGSVGIGVVIGATVGALAALVGGVVESGAMRVLEVLLAFPSLVLAIVAATYLGPSEINVTYAIAFLMVPMFARLARAGVLKLRDEPFIAAARMSGSGTFRTYVKHIVPNLLPQLTTHALLNVGMAIITESALSFLGLGVPAPHPSWGSMISTGQEVLTIAPYISLVPSAVLFATVLALNQLGDELRHRWGGSG